MSSPDEPTPLSPWPFLFADALALGTAFFIGSQAHSPYAPATVIAIGGLVATGAAVTALPFVINHARKQDALLAERQREIAALAQSVGACTEQLSIAAGSLHAIADNAVKSVKQAELLPTKLQEKIHEFKEQLNEVSATENEALSQEVNALRSAETERIESVVTTVRKLSGEFARLEAASRKHVSDLSDALSRFTKSAEQAAVEATTSIAALRAGSEKSLSDAQNSAVRAIEDSVRRGLAEFDTKLALFSGRLAAQLEHASSLLPAATASAPVLPSPNVRDESRPGQAHASDQRAHSAPLPDGTAAFGQSADSVAMSAQSMPPVSSAVRSASSARASDTNANAAASSSTPNDRTADVATTEQSPARKKSNIARRNDPSAEFKLGLELPELSLGDDFSQLEPESQASAAVSHDGLTRLVVTAYIGIGNKLFARGEGPGLSWDHGAPLQFISIGKWRWESPDAEAPVRIKLYKNDEQECAALGEVIVESGQQREVTATF